MNRRDAIMGLCAGPFLMGIGPAAAAATPVFAMEDPARMVDRLMALMLRGPSDPTARATAATELALIDPVALTLSVRALQDVGGDPAGVLAEVWDVPDAMTRDGLDAIRAAARETGDAGLRVGQALFEPLPTLTAGAFFDRLEAVSMGLPATHHPGGSFAAYQGWTQVTSTLAPVLGLSPTPGDPAMAIPEPLLFDPTVAQTLADRFEISPIRDDALLLAWLYRPSFEIFLAYARLPDDLPAEIVSPGPRLRAIYGPINAAQMGLFDAEERAMME